MGAKWKKGGRKKAEPGSAGICQGAPDPVSPTMKGTSKRAQVLEKDSLPHFCTPWSQKPDSVQRTRSSGGKPSQRTSQRQREDKDTPPESLKAATQPTSTHL